MTESPDPDLVAFTVPGRARRDGWTPERQQRFIAALSRTRSITAAARAAGLSRAAAYALRHRAGEDSGFTRAWNAALAALRSIEPIVTIDDLRRGTPKAYFYGGRQRAEWRVFDQKHMLRILREYHRHLRRCEKTLASSPSSLSSSELPRR